MDPHTDHPPGRRDRSSRRHLGRRPDGPDRRRRQRDDECAFPARRGVGAQHPVPCRAHKPGWPTRPLLRRAYGPRRERQRGQWSGRGLRIPTGKRELGVRQRSRRARGTRRVRLQRRALERRRDRDSVRMGRGLVRDRLDLPTRANRLGRRRTRPTSRAGATPNLSRLPPRDVRRRGDDSGKHLPQSKPAEVHIFEMAESGGTLASAVTAEASSISEVEATLQGTVNPNGSAVYQCKFEYGTTSAYGSSVQCSQATGSGTEPIAVSATVVSLQPGARYHFRVFAKTDAGTSYGSDGSFVTNPGLTARTEAAGEVSASEATLDGSYTNPNAGEVGCRFEYGRTTSYGAIAPCTPSQRDSGKERERGGADRRAGDGQLLSLPARGRKTPRGARARGTEKMSPSPLSRLEEKNRNSVKKSWKKSKRAKKKKNRKS